MFDSPVLSGVALIVSLVCAYLSDKIAARKGARHAGFAVLGFVLGPIGLAVAMLRKPVGLGRP